MRSFIVCLLVLAAASSMGQTISIKRIELIGEKVVIHFDLDDSNPNNAYLLNLYASKDNFATPLQKVTGDVGMDVKPGAGKKVEWMILQEFGGYKGKLALEIRGKVYVPFVRLQDFGTGKSFRRGKGYNVNWKPGNSNPVNIDLYKGSQRISGENNHPNNGNYTMFIPAGTKPGKDYRLKITDSRNSEEVIYTNTFKIQPKIPVLVKALPIAAVAGVVAWVILKDKPVNEDEINDPPFPQ